MPWQITFISWNSHHQGADNSQTYLPSQENWPKSTGNCLTQEVTISQPLEGQAQTSLADMGVQKVIPLASRWDQLCDTILAPAVSLRIFSLQRHVLLLYLLPLPPFSWEHCPTNHLFLQSLSQLYFYRTGPKIIYKPSYP